MSKRVLADISGGLLVLLGTCLILSLVWIGVAFFGGYFSDDNELVSQHEWSIVQAVWSAQRDTRLVEPKVFRESRIGGGETRTLLGVPAKDGTGNVWILLDPKAAPKIKVLPNNEFSLTTSQFASVEKEVRDQEVKQFLKERLTH